MSVDVQPERPLATNAVGRPTLSPRVYVLWGVIVCLLYALYQHTFVDLRFHWDMEDSYYSHGYLVPFISLFFVWRERKALREAPVRPCIWGYPLLAVAVAMFALGGFLGFGILYNCSIPIMVAALILILLGWAHFRLLWFPTAFLYAMIPIPASVTQSLSLQIKLLATEASVQAARLIGLPMVRDGSYIHFRGDSLLVGEVCGGLRSVIALLALGSLAAYVSKSRPWARLLLLALSAPIAVVANIARILLLCIVGYYWGSETASGTVHDVSGALIFVVAFILLFSLEALLRRVAPAVDAHGERP